MNRFKFTAIALVAALFLAGPLAAAPSRYVFQDLGVLPNCESSGAYAVNNAGQVSGFGLQAYPLPSYPRAFLKNYGQPMQDLGTLGGNYAWAQGINNAGQVVGWSELDLDLQNDHAFLKKPGEAMVDLGYQSDNPFGEARGINRSGLVVGWSYNMVETSGGWLVPGNQQAFLKAPGQPMETW